MRSLLVALCLLLSITPFAQKSDSVTLQQLREDLQFVAHTIADMHPQPWHSISNKKFRKLQDSLLSTVHGPVAAEDAWRLVARLCAALDEGHTTAYFPESFNKGLAEERIGLFPFAISDISREGFTVRGDLSDDSSLHNGDRIIAINGRSTMQIYDDLTSLFGGLPAYRKVRAMQDLLGNLYNSGLRGPFTIRYLQDGVIKEKTVSDVKRNALIARITELRKRFPAASKPAPYSFERLPDGSGLLRFNSMSTDYDAFERFLKDTFAALQSMPVKGLIVDLRRNGGGNSALGAELLQYISSKPFRMGGGFVWKVSASYKNWFTGDSSVRSRLSEKSWSDYLEIKNGTMLRGSDQPHAPGDNPLRFKGPVCVLIGPNTFSSANMTANAIQDYKLATLIGEPSGEPANDFGEIAFFDTPHSRINFSTSSKQFVRASGDARDMNPVLPDILVKQDPKSGEDEVLAAARKWVLEQ